VLTGGSTSADGGAAPGLFGRRENNSVNYDSPTFGGFQLMVSTSATNTATSATTAQVAAKPRLWSLGGTYANGPLNIAAGYEQHSDFSPAGVPFSGRDKGWHLSGGYVVGPVKLGAIYTRQKFEPSPGTDLQVNVWQLAADWHIVGPHGLRAAWTHAGDTSGNYSVVQPLGGAGVGIAGGGSVRVANGGAGGTGATLWQIHYVDTLSKRTEATVGYARLDNKNNASYALGGLSTPAQGTDQSVWGVTMRHRF